MTTFLVTIIATVPSSIRISIYVVATVSSSIRLFVSVVTMILSSSIKPPFYIRRPPHKRRPPQIRRPLLTKSLKDVLEDAPLIN